MIHFCGELKEIMVSQISIKLNNYLFSTSTASTNELDDSVPVTYL